MSKSHKKPATDSQPPPNQDSRPQFEDHRLRYVYSVIEIATLAAGCRASSLEERVEEAVQLLSAIERSAALSKDQKERDILNDSLTRKFKEVPTPQSLTAKLDVMKTIRKEESRWRRICENAERDKNVGQIKLSSLLLTAFISVDESRPVKTLEHARRLFNEWLKEMFRESREHTDLSEDEWILQFKACYVHRSTAGDLLHDESSARLLVIQFLSWYENRSKSERTRGIRSQKEGTKGQFVKETTRGAERNEDGQYSACF